MQNLRQILERLSDAGIEFVIVGDYAALETGWTFIIDSALLGSTFEVRERSMPVRAVTDGSRLCKAQGRPARPSRPAPLRCSRGDRAARSDRRT